MKKLLSLCAAVFLVFGTMSAFAADLTGVWTSCFMLMFALVATAMLWMHLAIRRMERREMPGIRQLPQLPELQGLGEKAPPRPAKQRRRRTSTSRVPAALPAE